MPLVFEFDKVSSPIFGFVYRPVAWVEFWSKTQKRWIGIWTVVDSGADYSLLPRYMSRYLGINFLNDCKAFSTYGIGGKENVFLLEKAKIKLGAWEVTSPVGFLERDTVPPLLGRHGFMEKFSTLFFDHKTYFTNKAPRFKE